MSKTYFSNHDFKLLTAATVYLYPLLSTTSLITTVIYGPRKVYEIRSPTNINFLNFIIATLLVGRAEKAGTLKNAASNQSLRIRNIIKLVSYISSSSPFWWPETKASTLRACFTVGMSIMWPLKENAPRPSASCARNAAISWRAHSTRSGAGRKARCTTGTWPGWITCLPVKPKRAPSKDWRSRPSRSCAKMPRKFF